MDEDNQFLASASSFVPQPQRARKGKRSDNSELYSFDADKREQVFITHICATGVASGLRRTPAGFYVSVEIDGKTSKTSNKLEGKGMVEWDEEILLPSERSSTISFRVYASLEGGTKRGNGVLVRRFKTTVGDVLDSNEELQPIRFLDKAIKQSYSSLRIITERRICDIDGFAINTGVLELDTTSHLARLTDIARHALLRYRELQNQKDLDEAIAYLERARDMCPLDHPNYSSALFNLATAKFIHCQDNHHYIDLDVPIRLYQDALQLRTSNHPDHCVTALDLCFALLARLQRQSNNTDRARAKDLLPGVVESYAYRAAWFALQMAGISVPLRSMEFGTSQTDTTSLDDEVLIRRLRAMLSGFSERAPGRLALLTFLGGLLCHRFESNGDLVDINGAILMLENAVKLAPDRHPEKLGLLNCLAASLSCRFRRLGDLVDINKSISISEEALRHTPNGDPDKPVSLSSLGDSLRCRFERLGDLADINMSVSMQEEAVGLTPNGYPGKPARLNNLGTSLHCRFERLGHRADIDKSISMFELSLRLTPNDHPDKPARLNNLGLSLLRRFECLGDLTDINQSILTLDKAVRLTPNGDPGMPGWLSNLALSLMDRFKHLGDLADINQSILILEQAIRLTPNGHPDKPTQLNNLGISLSCRFKHLGDLGDIETSISVLEEAVRLTPNDHPGKLARLVNLGNSLLSRFEHLGDLADLSKSITLKEEVVHLTPNDHTDKPAWSSSLGSSLFCRFEHLGDLADLDKSISLQEEAVRLIPNSHPAKPVQLSSLGSSFLSRFEHLGDPADINKSILMRQEALRLTPNGHPDKPALLNSLGSSLISRFECLGDLADMNESTAIFEEALRLTPNSHPEKPVRLNSLGQSLLFRFEHLGDLVDINKSISVLEEALRLTPNGYPHKQTRLSNLGISLYRRFEHLGDLADVTKSILLSEEAVGLTPDSHPDKPAWLSNLGNSLHSRFDRLGDPVDINMSISTHEDAVRLTPNGHPDKPIWLNNLGTSLTRRYRYLGDLEDISKSISVFEEAVCHTPDGHPGKPARMNNLGLSLIRRFERLGHLADISKSISMLEEAAHLTPNGHPDKHLWSNNLGTAFMSSFERSHDPSSLLAATLHFSVAARSSTGPTYSRFRAAHSWILSARLERNSQALLDACTTAINLLPELAWIGLPLIERHRLLSGAADVARDAAAAALEAGRPELAVEWLEQGRSIVWSQFLHLRTPVDELHVEHPALARQFQQISRELEHASSRDRATFRGSANDLVDDSRSPEEEVQRHHDLALRREKLLANIRSLPGLDQFLLPKTIKQLAAFAHSGPVVYLNASKQRCDALIVSAALEHVVPVLLPSVNYEEIVTLQRVLRLLLERNRLIISRDDISALIPSDENLASQHLLDMLLVGDDVGHSDRAARVKPQRIEGYTPDDLFREILAYLWNQVVHPVLEMLGVSTPPFGTEKKTRIFWCSTGPFAFLPIHAAGLYGTAEAGAKLSDFAISSYIPTLGALAPPTQNDPNSPSPNIHLVVVPQPPTDGLGGLVSVKEEIDRIRMLSARSPFVTLRDSHSTVEDVMEKMKNADWVHFACHGVQDLDSPLDSGLCLADNRRLKLSDIIQLSRPQGGLAFLSACQTAQGDEKLSEESVHLAAGMLLAGYGGVIATMWAIRDPDAPKVAKDVYEYLFRDGKVPDCTEAAEALHYAVEHLRDSGASFSSWVPFIHVGR